MDIGIWMIAILFLGLTPTLIATILCLILIKKNPYKKLSKKQIYAGFWQRFLAGIIDSIILIVIEVILILIPIIGQIIHFYLDSQLWKFTNPHNRENVYNFIKS